MTVLSQFKIEYRTEDDTLGVQAIYVQKSTQAHTIATALRACGFLTWVKTQVEGGPLARWEDTSI